MSSHALKILVLADSRSFHTERYVEELQRQGCEVSLASLERGRIRQHTLKRRGLFRQLHYVVAGREVRSLARRTQPDIINPHFASGYGFLAAVAGLTKLFPVVLNLWGSDILLVPSKSNLHRRKTAFAISKADCLIGDSEYLVDEALQLARNDHHYVIPWGLERKYMDLHRPSYAFNRPLRIIVPRPHEAVYNNVFILRALAPLVNDGLVEVRFPSAGSLSTEFRTQAKTLIGNTDIFYDRLVRDEFMKYMAGFDVYLSSARSDSSPASMIEAMGLGLIPIAANIPGVREWLSSGNGYMYEPYDCNGLRAIIQKLVDSGDTHELWRRENFERVNSTAIFEDNVGRAIEIMRQAIARRSH